jgi:hypothetical protein
LLQQKQTSSDLASKDSHVSHAATQENAKNRMIDDDHQSNGSSEAEMIYHAKQQQLFSLVIEIPTSPDYTNGKIIKFLKQTRDFLIADPELGPDVRHVSEILPKFQKINKDLESRDDNIERQQQKRQTVGYRLIINLALQETVEKIKDLSFEFENKDYVFIAYVSVKEQRQKQNKSSRSRSVQVYNASLDISTSLIKPFLRRYGELEENGVYASRKNPYQPNKQVFYATFKESASAEKFYSNPILWVYNEMLYVTPLELSLEKRQERREFCAKLNGLPPNANAREYQEFIEEFNVFEFRIPRNTRTNRMQLYAYVYFKDEKSMSYAMERVIVRRNKQHEWSPPDMKSCFNCGYTSHLISECDYRPPRTRPINKREYLNSINQQRQDNRFQRQQKRKPTSYADAARQRPCHQPTSRPNNSFNGNNNYRTWNYDNVNRNIPNENYQDDEDIYNWNEESEDEYQFSQRQHVRARDNRHGIHTRNKSSTDNQKIASDTIQEIKNDLASLQDVVKTLAISLESTAAQLNNYINNQKQDKNKEKEPDVMQIDGPKKRRVVFNDNNKRPQNADSSDSNSSNNKNNNVTLLSAQISELGSVMKTVTESLNNINNRVSKLDSNENINRPVVGGSRAVSNNTQNNY